MIYIFGKGRNLSIIYDETTLTENDKINSLVVKELPLKETPKGYVAFLTKENNTLRWEYEEIIEEEE
jgi:hypothetical protein